VFDGDDEDDPDRRAKVVVVGDGAVGKTCLFITYATGKFPEEYVPTVFENYTLDTTYNKEPFLLHMWDTAGQEDYDRLRPLSYPGTDVVVLCFSLVNESTFESIRMKWNPEINHYLDGIPKILVGTKLDMREQKITDGGLTKYEEIDTAEGQDLAKEIGAFAYIETSPLTGKNLNEVFEKVISAALSTREPEEPKPKKKKSKSKKEEPEGKSRRRSKSKPEGEKKKKKKRKNPDETSEERRERRRKRREAREAKDGKRKKRSKTESGEKKERKKKKKSSKE
jgi:Ras-related C3 botulinum toxin substrate 1